MSEKYPKEINPWDDIPGSHDRMTPNPVYADVITAYKGISANIILKRRYVGMPDEVGRDVGPIYENVEPTREFEVGEDFEINPESLEGYPRGKLDEYEYEEMAETHCAIHCKQDLALNYIRCNGEPDEPLQIVEVIENKETGEIRIIRM